MPFTIHIYHHAVRDAETDRALERILGTLARLEQHLMSKLTDALDAAEAAAKADADAQNATMNLLAALSAQIADLKVNSTDAATIARIQALADATNQRAAALAAAVVANTPAAPQTDQPQPQPAG